MSSDDPSRLGDPPADHRLASLTGSASGASATSQGSAFPRQVGGLKEASGGGLGGVADRSDSPLPSPGPRIAAPEVNPTGHAPRVAPAGRRRVVHADEGTFSQEVLRADVPVLVDFYADWCGPCRALSPTIQELAAEVPGAKVVKVNIDESPELADHYGVKSIPSLMVFKDGQPSARQTGPTSKARLKAMLEQ